MFQDLRTGDVAFLGDMPDQNDRDACLLCEPEKDSGDFLDLGHRARSRINGLREHCLDGVNDHQVWLDLTCLCDDILNQCLAIDLTVGGIATQAIGTHLDLTQTLLTGNVQCLE